MKRAAILFLLGLGLSGCWCKGCRGETVSPWANDLVITATEAKEFKDTVEDLWNLDASAAAGMLFVIATGAEIPSGTATVEINTAQLNRWFNTEAVGSCVSRIYWHLGKLAANRHMLLRHQVMEEAARQARRRIESPTAEARFISRLEIMSPTGEEY